MDCNNFDSREDLFDPKLPKYNSDFMMDDWSPDSMDLLDSIFDTDLLNLNDIDNLSMDIKNDTITNDFNLNDITFNDNPININSSPTSSSSSSSSVPSTYIKELQISSNSSDSGLSSDNLDMDISPEYEPLSPAISSPGPSISERGEKNSPQRNDTSSSSSSPSYLNEHLFKMDSKEFHYEDEEENDKLYIKLPPPQPQKQQQQHQQHQPIKTFVHQQKQQQKIQQQPSTTKVIVQKIPQIMNLPTKRTLNQQSPVTIQTKDREIKILKISPASIHQSFINSSNNGNGNGNKKVTIQLKNTSNIIGNCGKIQTKPGTFLINNKGRVTEVKKLIPVQAPTTSTSNPRSILLPVTDMKGLKTYKLLNMSSLKNYGNTNKISTTTINSNSTTNSTTTTTMMTTTTKVPTVVKQIQNKPKIIEQFSDHISDVESLILEDINNEDDTEEYIEECHDDDDYDDDDDIINKNSSFTTHKKNNLSSSSVSSSSSSSYPRLILSSEEKRLLSKEGITLPSHYPLTKYEERELKRIRRKIRNKISAQDSRKRKKEYVDGLEERVKQCTEENQTLLKKIKLLQTQNHNLMTQMKKLQSLLSKGTNKTAHPTTCLLVLLLSLALVATPNLKFGQNTKEIELNEMIQQDDLIGNDGTTNSIQNQRRSLLFDVKDHLTSSSLLSSSSAGGLNINDILDEDINMNDFMNNNNGGSSSGSGNGGNDITTKLANEFLLNYCNKMNNDSLNSNEYPTICKKFKNNQNFIDFDIDDNNWYQQQQQQQQQQKQQKTIYDLAAESYQKNKSQQTSGFNIDLLSTAVKQQKFDENLINEMMMKIMTTKYVEKLSGSVVGSGGGGVGSSNGGGSVGIEVGIGGNGGSNIDVTATSGGGGGAAAE